MEWYVAKTGFGMFDALHAYGLSVLLAGASDMPIAVRDGGPVYHLSSQWKLFLSPSIDVFDNLFELPTVDDLLLLSSRKRRVSVPLATLDGLLAALFTRGERFLSVNDLVGKVRFDPSAAEKGLNKVSRAVKRWKEYVLQETQSAHDWLHILLRDYTDSSLAFPVPGVLRRTKDLTAVMTLDPAFGYSTRRPTSDGLVNRKVNVSLYGARYATLLAYLGATRCLRAQRVARGLVNLYVPLAEEITMDRSTTFATLDSMDCTSQHAHAHQLLALLKAHSFVRVSRERGMAMRCEAPIRTECWRDYPLNEARWKGLSYQVLQTQGMQQSISLDRGVLECEWIVELERKHGMGITRFWRSWLQKGSDVSRDTQERLVEFIISRRVEAWSHHLCDIARHVYFKKGQRIRLYSLEEVKSIVMTASAPLRTILERDEGTLRFGRALRQLGQYNPSILRDLLEVLETVQTLEQLIHILHRAMQECVLAKAKYPFIRIPSTRDFAVLTSDAEQYGVRLLASTLMMLSALRYDPSEIDKYEVHTLIGALLALTTQMPPVGDSSLVSSDTATETSPVIETISLDEGEPDL